MSNHVRAVFRAEKLTFAFPGKQVVDAVDFALHAGTITCLLGGNGAGKTTLFNLVTGFLRPDSGNIRFGDTDLANHPPYRISRLGVVRTFQDLRLIGKLSVRDNLLLAQPQHPSERLGRALLPSHFHKKRNAADLCKADTLLEEFHLAQVADQAASEISYGQQKLLTLACCAAMDARLLLLDEPVAGISPDLRERIAERLDGFKAAGKTILLIEHQADFLEHTGDAFLYLQGGKLHGFDTLDELRASPAAHDAFI
ncbi:MAG: ATP-binding cassette domain-containing protein [Anaerolineales bacterium]